MNSHIDAQSLMTRGDRYARGGQYEKAIKDYNSAVETDPGYQPAYLARGLSYYEIGEYQRAIADLSHAIDLNPKDDIAYARRAMAYIFSDQLTLAQADEEMCDFLRNV